MYARRSVGHNGVSGHASLATVSQPITAYNLHVRYNNKHCTIGQSVTHTQTHTHTHTHTHI